MLCEQRGYFRRATGVTFFERGCFASRGGTFDMQRGGGGSYMHATGCAIIILPKYYY